jgi:uncharacterized membrane protein YkvA (DUF1232 family)
LTKKPYTPSEEDLSEALNRRKNRAEEYLNDPERSRILLEQAKKKAEKNKGAASNQPEFWENLKTVFRLFKAYIRKEYTRIPWGSIVMVTGAILYFVSPIDLMLDWIPLLGFVDDAAVLVFVLRQLRADLEKFRAWEEARQNPPTIIDL